jgi:hypothetical protein
MISPGSSAPRATIRNPMTDPLDIDRIYLGSTSDRYVCDSCDAWVEMERLADARGWEQIDGGDKGVGWASIDPGSLDPPLQPTLYRCSRCGYEHVGQPSLKNPT